MAMRKNTLPDDPEALKKIILQLQSKVNFLEEQFLLARSKQFSSSTVVSLTDDPKPQIQHCCQLSNEAGEAAYIQ